MIPGMTPGASPSCTRWVRRCSRTCSGSRSTRPPSRTTTCISGGKSPAPWGSRWSNQTPLHRSRSMLCHNKPNAQKAKPSASLQRSCLRIERRANKQKQGERKGGRGRGREGEREKRRQPYLRSRVATRVSPPSDPTGDLPRIEAGAEVATRADVLGSPAIAARISRLASPLPRRPTPLGRDAFTEKLVSLENIAVLLSVSTSSPTPLEKKRRVGEGV